MFRNFIVLVVVILAACNQETIIGTELITDQVVDIQFTDNIDITAKSIQGEPLDVFVIDDGATTNLGLILMGESDDHLYGNAQTTAFFAINLNPNDTLRNVDQIDSIVLTIPLDTIGSYGDTTAFHNFELFALNETLTGIDTFSTGDFFDYDPMPIGGKMFVPDARDSLDVYDPVQDSTVAIRSHIRIPITDVNYTSSLISETQSADGNDTIFQEQVFGFALKSSTDQNSFVSLNMSNSLAALTEVNVYYQNNGNKELYSYPIGTIRSFAFEHDLSGSETESSINDKIFSDSLLFIQGMRGPNIEVDISALKNLKPGSLNYARLDFKVASQMDDNFQPPIERIGAFYKNSEGNLENVRDLSIGDGPTVSIGLYFDGFVQDDVDTIQYNMNLTSHAIDFINENVLEDKIILVPFNKQTFANRAAIFGTKHSELPMQLKIIQTNP